MSLKEAKDPQTPQERLAELYQSHEAQIREALVENPSTPLVILFELAAHYPEGFLRNPMLSLLLLEDPNFLHQAPPETVEALAMVRQPPGWLFPSIATYPSAGVRLGLITAASTPLPLLELLANDKEEFIRVLVPRNPSVPLTLLERLAKNKSPAMRGAIASNPNVSEKLLMDLSQDPDESVRLCVARSAFASAGLLALLTQDKGEAVRIAAQETIQGLGR